MKVAFKIPVGFASHLVCQRETRNTYQTNRAVKLYGFYALLKTMTSSGVIQNYHKQIADIGALTKKSRSGVYSYIVKCIRAGLLRTDSKNIHLKGWEAAVRLNPDCEFIPSYTTVYYDSENELQTPEYLIYACEIAENQQRQTKAVIKQIEENLPLAQTLNVQQTATPKDVIALQKLQVFTFVNGRTDNDYSLLHSLNADVQRTAKTLRRTYSMKSRRSVKYLKKQLEKRGVAKVMKRRLESPERSRVNANLYYTGYNPANRNTFWQRPDLIELLVA